MNQKENKCPVRDRSTVIFSLAAAFLLFLALLLLLGVRWFYRVFGFLSFSTVLFTINSPLQGSNPMLLKSAAKHIIAAAAGSVMYFSLIYFADAFFSKDTAEAAARHGSRAFRRVSPRNLYRISVFFFSSAALAGSALFALLKLGIYDYYFSLKETTTIYEEYYVDPAQVSIEAAKKPKNLICIYLESMETAYASRDAGGMQEDDNYIPRLTQTANENVSFSNGDKLGGYYSVTGTNWTMGALFASTTGIPFSFPTGENRMGYFSSFAGGTVGLGDILAEKGYHQEFLCGSDGAFGGRKTYFQQHGSYEIFDLFTAREKGYIPPDYHNGWWGYEDSYLYQIAGDEAVRLADEGTPFNLTILTVDTHFVSGYVCPLCGTEYPEETANVVACADRQVDAFIEWCQAQPFYENTVIVALGDHPRMDTLLVGEAGTMERPVYNCFLNAENAEGAETKNRVATTMDLFPTILSAMGFEIEGSRLGLGTDLFSDQPTLAETMGLESLDAEISKYSDYYLKNFS